MKMHVKHLVLLLLFVSFKETYSLHSPRKYLEVIRAGGTSTASVTTTTKADPIENPASPISTDSQSTSIPSNSIRPLPYLHKDHLLAVTASIGLIVISNKYNYQQLALYGWTLLGSSIGFRYFLHFISIGYAMGIALPTLVTLIQHRSVFNNQLLALVPGILVTLWGIRLATFLTYREYFDWPALHKRVVLANAQNAPSTTVKVLCWLVYSLFYLCMSSSVSIPLLTVKQSKQERLGMVPVIVQVMGLVLESVADWQKSSFKRQQHGEWCNVGLYRISRHPNYLGEWIFWLGTWMSGVMVDAIPVTIGFGFISLVMKGAIESLSTKHEQKYGGLPEFDQFVERVGLIPKFWRRGIKTSTSVVEETTKTTTETVQVTVEEPNES